MLEDEVQFMRSTSAYLPPISSAASSVSSREPRLQSTKCGDGRMIMRILKSLPAGSFGIHGYPTKVTKHVPS